MNQVQDILVVKNLERRFGGIAAVDVVHLAVREGEITSLIGPNGAGKTTLFNVLTGFDRAQSGSWYFDGKEISSSGASGIAKLGMVRTFQLTKTLEKLTVLENIMLGAQHHRGEALTIAPLHWLWGKRERESELLARTLLKDVRLDDYAQAPAGILSGGQRKLLELARAIMSRPKLIMMDEPMAGVNPALREKLLEQIQSIQANGASVLLIEHDMDVVREVSDRVVCLSEGRVIATGTAEEVASDANVVEAYLGADDAPTTTKDRGSATAASRLSIETPRGVEEERAAVMEAKEIVAGYIPGVDILQGCSVRVEAGELVGVLGPNGAGKSTLIKAMFGRAKTRGGQFNLYGENVNGLPDHELIKRGVGYVSQNHNVFPRLTVEENLRMGLYVSPRRWQRRRDEIVDIFPGLKNIFKRRAGNLSGGERQVVSLGRAMMLEPSLLILDEPSAGLAPVIQAEVFDHIRRLNISGVSTLMVEQNARQCLAVCDRGYILDQGKNAYTGTGDELLADEKVVNLYLGSLGTESRTLSTTE